MLFFLCRLCITAVVEDLREPSYARVGCGARHAAVAGYVRRPMNPKAALGFGIAHLIVSLACISMGIAMVIVLSEYYWLAHLGTPIWLGGFVLLTAIFHFIVSSNPSNFCMIATTRLFNIFCTIGCGIAGCVYLSSYLFYENCEENIQSLMYNELYSVDKEDLACLYKTKIGKIMFALSMALVAIEFFIALFASIYAGPGCCNGSHRSHTGVILNQPQSQFVSSSTHTTMTMQPARYPTTSYAANPQNSHHVNIGTGPMYTSVAPTSVNSTNLCNASQPTHDRAILICSDDGQTEMQPPPYC